MPPDMLERAGPSADWCLQWLGDGCNVMADLEQLQAAICTQPSELTRDILDIALALYTADIVVPRGRNEAWTRELSLLVPVRQPDFWEQNLSALLSILHGLTRDNFHLEFCARLEDCPELLRPVGAGGPADIRSRDVDCVCALSGGIDSLAGGTMLLRADRRPLFVSHRSGNPYVRQLQTAAEKTLDSIRPDTAVFANLVVQPRHGSGAEFRFPVPGDRESSRRLRTFLFMAMLTAAAGGVDVEEAYLCENGILTIALPMSPGRVGSLSTRSTHPSILAGFNALARAAGMKTTILNPFIYRTKAEIITDILRPVLTPNQIQATTSCWMSGRRNRPCGGCIPCLLRRISMLAAGLPDEAYEIDLLADPEVYRGTEAYDNLIDLLTQAVRVSSGTDEQLLVQWPQLLDLASAGVSVEDALAMYRRYAEEVWRVTREHFPAVALLMKRIG
jgi:hypothetical protein